MRLDTTGVSQRAAVARERLASCDLCPRQCRTNRLAGKTGYCHIGERAVVSNYGPHFGEERVLVGRRGSGTVFFAGCNLGCVFCQNDDISHGLRGHPVDDDELADIFLQVQQYRCHNLNLVTPSHVVPQILTALARAMRRGFNLPVVFNTGGYDLPETLALLDGVVDIYMPDYKFSDIQVALRFTEAPDYNVVAQAALREMHRQVGDLVLDEGGMAGRGLLVRHLVLPYGLAGTEEVMRFLAEEISAHTYVNVMGQYRPCFHAYQFDQLSRRPTLAEVEEAIAAAKDAGLSRLDKG